MATSTSDSTDSSPLLKLSSERAALLHEDELTPKSLSPRNSDSFSTDKVFYTRTYIATELVWVLAGCMYLWLPFQTRTLHIPPSHTTHTRYHYYIYTHTLHTHPSQPVVFSDPSFYVQPRALPLWRKLAYAVGAMPYSMCNTVVGFYLNIFLLEVAIVSGPIGGVCITSLILHNSATFPTWCHLCAQVHRSSYGGSLKLHN